MTKNKARSRFSISLVILFIVLSISSVLAQDRYWVGGTGSWNDTAHWSTTSGGPSGASVPTSANTVIFDAASFSALGTVNMSTGTCETAGIDFSTLDEEINIIPSSIVNIDVAGDYIGNDMVDFFNVFI